MIIKEHKAAITGKETHTIIQEIKGKNYKFNTVNYGFDWDQTRFKYRVITKCPAGFLTISEGEDYLCNVVKGYKKGALQTIEARTEMGTNFLTVFAMKAGKFFVTERSIIENITVGDVRVYFPNMADEGHWKAIASKNWGDKAYGKMMGYRNDSYVL